METEVAPNYERVRTTVRKVLRDNHVLRPPISPRDIALNNGLRVQPVSFDEKDNDVAGLIDFDKKIIYVNAQDAFNRQTFTVAHELGHYFLHRDLFKQDPERYNVLLRRPIGQDDDPLEKEANAFAADLLVPRKYLNFYSRYADQQELADLFAVSMEVIGYRMSFGAVS